MRGRSQGCGVREVGLPEEDAMDGVHDDGGHDKMYGMVQGETVDMRRCARAISCPRPKGESGKSDCKTAGGVYRNGLKAGSQC